MRRLAVLAQLFGQGQAIQTRHLDVQKDDIGRQFVGQAQRIESIRRARDDFRFRPRGGQLRLQVFEQMRFVVRNQDAWLVDGGGAFKGSIILTVMPHG